MFSFFSHLNFRFRSPCCPHRKGGERHSFKRNAIFFPQLFFLWIIPPHTSLAERNRHHSLLLVSFLKKKSLKVHLRNVSQIITHKFNERKKTRWWIFHALFPFQFFVSFTLLPLSQNIHLHTGAQILYKYLPMSAGLRRLVFYKRHDLHLLKNRQNLDLLSSGGGEEHAQEEEDTGGLESEIPLISYVLLCECLTLSESILASVCAVIDQLRARCCGYSALYINYSLEGGSQQQLQQQHLTSSSATTTVTRTSGDVYHHHQQQPILHPLEQPQVPPTAMAESVLHSTYLPGHLHHHPSPAAHQQTGSLRYQQHLPLQPHPYDR